jgi:predicted nuclease of predicted toxin-antitoxin system
MAPMQFLADMGVSTRVADWLRSQGHDVVHLRDRDLQRMPNGDIFQLAGQEQRIILTFDLDFGEIVAGSGGLVVSVILFRLHDTRTDHVIQRLESVLLHSSADLVQGAIIVAEESRHRIRKLPIGS